MRVQDLHLRNFRIFRKETLEGFRGLNVFIGPNGGGKSTVLQALNLLLSGGGSIGFSGDFIFGRQPGSAFAIECNLTFSPEEVRMLVTATMDQLNLNPPPESAMAGFNKALGHLKYSCTGGSPRMKDTVFNLNNLLLSGGNGLVQSLGNVGGSAKAVLDQNGQSIPTLERVVRQSTGDLTFYMDINRRLSPQFGVAPSARVVPSEVGRWFHEAVGAKNPRFEEFEKVMGRHLPHVKGIVFKPVGSNFQLGVTEQGFDDMTPAHAWSTGTSHLGLMLGTFVGMPSGAVVLMEEPEVSLYPGAIRNLMEDIRGHVASHEAQFFITTHSPVVVEELDPELKDHTLWQCNRNSDGSASAQRCGSEKEVAEAIDSLHARPKGTGE